jgi:hypothetical protein
MLRIEAEFIDVMYEHNYVMTTDYERCSITFSHRDTKLTQDLRFKALSASYRIQTDERVVTFTKIVPSGHFRPLVQRIQHRLHARMMKEQTKEMNMKVGSKVQLKGTKRTGVVFEVRETQAYVLWKKGIGAWSLLENLKLVTR